ncbi:MAG: hypothetical protein HY794_17605 [Desulfarculus sp.]|nr:hypothetical protein [Desulfarculus sp.]
MTLEPATLKRRLLATACLLLAAGLLLGLGEALCRWFVYPRPTQAQSGLLAQRHADARLASPAGPAYLEQRREMGHQADTDFRAENFSLRLTGYLTVALPGPYQLGVESDDDARLYLDGVKLIDNSGRHPMFLRAAWVWLGPGPHLLEVEYAQRDGGAGLRLLLRPPWRSALAPMPLQSLTPSQEVFSRPQAEHLGARASTALLPLAALVLWLVMALAARVWLPFLAGRHLVLALAGLVMSLGMWLCSGTMSLYGATTPQSSLAGPCQYVVNIDHMHFQATYRMLQGQDLGQWGFSLVLRRILYPLVAYPFMRLMGYMEGGFLANLALALVALYGWAVFLGRRVGPRGAWWGTWLLARYPGLAYWGGLPYSYAIIVPACLGGFMLLEALSREERPRRVLLYALLLGVLSLGYDLLPFFAPAALGLVWWRGRRLLPLGLCLAGLALPGALLLLIMEALGVPASSQNAQQPLAIVMSYFQARDWPAWWGLLQKVPGVLAGNFLASNFYVLPLLFLIAALANRGRGRVAWQPAEKALLWGLLAVFLFNNLAPPHNFGTFRGDYAARFYQASLAVMLYFLARRLEALPPRSWLAWLCAVAMLANAALVAGPLLRLPLASQVHWRFYRHAPDGDYLTRALDNMGRRPLGLCAPRPRQEGPAQPVEGNKQGDG